MAPVLVLNPIDDERFATFARRLLPDAVTIGGFERELRRSYPHAVVRRRGLSDEAVDVWYVYRDGTWVPPV